MFEVALGRVTDGYGRLDEEASKYYTKALAFQDKMNEKLATNKVELMQYQAMYYSMFKSQGINKDASYLMSESLTKAGYDIASLYNLDTHEAVEKIRAGIAGQVEPLRAIGIDISESALERVLNDAGIERSVQQLSYAEKEVARYIAIVQQAGQAQGDFARTFEQPANQLRVFKNQLAELSQVAGAFAVNAFGGLITWANGAIMAIKEVLIAIATLFGWDLNFSGSGFSEVSDTVDDIGSGIGGATKKAKEFKNQLMGFDEINNITLPKDSSGGSGSASGVDSKLLDSLKEWDNKMESVRGKAQEIRDNILDWFGFTRDVNGNLTWAWKDMNGIAKVLTTIVGIVGGFTLLGKLVKFVNWVKKLYTILKTGKGAVTSFGLGVTTFAKGFSNLKSYLGMAIDQFGIYYKQTGSITTATSKTVAELWKFSPALKMLCGGAGLAGLIVTTITSVNAMKQLSDGTKTADQAFKEWGLSMAGATASGALIGTAILPGIGTALGALGGLVVSVTAGFIAYDNELEKSAKRSKELAEAIEESGTAYTNQKQAIKESAEAKILELQYVENLKERLSHLVDENGKVISGYEERVDFILGELNSALDTEYKREGDIIQGYKDMQTEIDNIIEAKKNEIKQEAYLELYREAIKKQVEDTKKQVQAQKEFNDVLAERKAIEDETWSPMKIAHMHDYNVAYEEAKENLDAINESLRQTTDEISFYESEYVSLARGVTTTTDTISTEVSQAVIDTTNQMKELAKTNTDEFILRLNEMDTATKANMLAQSTTISTLSPQVQKEWNKLATESRDAFVTAINQVPSDAQGAILSSITEVEGLNDATKEAWSNLSKTAKDEFNEEISKVAPITRGQILASMAETTELTDDTAMAWAKLAEEDNKAYNAGIASLDTDTANKVQNAIDEVNRRKGSAQQAGSNVGSGIKSSFDGGLGDTGNSARNFVQGFINVISGNPLGIFQVIGGLASSIVAHFNSGLGNHSPSKKTKQSAIYFVEGFQLQLNREIPETIKQVSSFANDLSDSFSNNLDLKTQLAELNDGVKINTKDYEVDTNSYIDYGTLNGNISTMSKVELEGSLIEEMATKIVNGINDRKIDVNITAKTDKGTIVETAVDGIKDYANRTGSLPFPVPV